MEQKDYIMEILGVLMEGEGHIRGIAKKLGTNHMMVLRKLKKLLDKNVVDFKREGKNQIYSLKDTPEARAFILMAENYKLVKCIEKYPYLKDVLKKIQDDKKIKLAILFGSHAKEQARKDSDIDIFIETLERKIKERYSELDSRLSIKIGKLGKDVLSKEIAMNHVIIKGIELYYENVFN